MDDFDAVYVSNKIYIFLNRKNTNLYEISYYFFLTRIKIEYIFDFLSKRITIGHNRSKDFYIQFIHTNKQNIKEINTFESYKLDYDYIEYTFDIVDYYITDYRMKKIQNCING